MKERHYLFLFVLSATFMLGITLTAEWDEAIFLTGYYFISTYVVIALNRGSAFFTSFEENRFGSREKTFLLSGQEHVAIDREDQRKDAFIDTFEPKARASRAAVPAILSVMAVFLAFESGHSSFMFFAHIGLAGLMMSALYIGHLLTVLLINILLVGAKLSGDHSLALYALYTTLCVFSVYLSGAGSLEQFKKAFTRKKTLLLLGLSLAVFILILLTHAWLKDFKFPDLVRPGDPVLKEQIRKTRQQLSTANGRFNSREYDRVPKARREQLQQRINKTSQKLENLERKLESPVEEEEIVTMKEEHQQLVEETRDIKQTMPLAQNEKEWRLQQTKEKYLENGQRALDLLKTLENVPQGSQEFSSLQEQVNELARKNTDLLASLTSSGNSPELQQNQLKMMESLTPEAFEKLFQKNKELLGLADEALTDPKAAEKWLQDFENHSQNADVMDDQLQEKGRRLSEIEGALLDPDTPSSELERLTEEKRKIQGEHAELFNRLNQELAGKEKAKAEVKDYLEERQMSSPETQKVLEKKEMTPEDKQIIQKTIKEAASPSKAPKKFSSPETPREATPETEPEYVPEQKKSVQDSRSPINKFLAGLAALGLLYLWNKFFRKKKVRKVLLDPEVYQELRAEWKQLKKQSFTPREEVIHYYNLLHESLQKIHYTEHETPPACVVADDMRELEPRLEQPTRKVTDIFSRCFYGDKEVTSDMLGQFRDSLKKILKVYRLS